MHRYTTRITKRLTFTRVLPVSDVSGIPGYTPVTKATPIWKRDMIEKKNQEKIEEYIVGFRTP